MSFQTTTDILYGAVGKNIKFENYDTLYPKDGIVSSVAIYPGSRVKNDVVTITYRNGPNSYTVEFAYSAYFTQVAGGFQFVLPWCEPRGQVTVTITGF